MREHFRNSVGAPRMERRVLILWCRLNLAKHLAAAGLVKAGPDAGMPDGLEHAKGAEGRHLGRKLRYRERRGDMALGGEIVDLIGPRRCEHGQD